MKSMTRQIGMILGALLLLVRPGTAGTDKGYIDVHVHLRGTTQSGMLGNAGQGRAKTDRRKGSSGSKEKNLRTAAELMIEKMDRFGVEHALVVVVPGKQSPESEFKSMRKIVNRYPDRLKLMAGGARLSPYLQGKAPEAVTEKDCTKFRRLAAEILDDGAVGFGEMIAYHLSMANHHSFQVAPADHPLFLVLADVAAEHDVPMDLHMEAIVESRPTPSNLRAVSTKNPETLEPTIPALERLLAHNRKARIVWQHIGWDNTGDMTPGLVRRLLSAHSNLFIALRVERRARQVGDGPPMANRLVDREGSLKAEWRSLIETFPDRVTLGSDEFFFPVEKTRPNQSFAETWALLDQLPPELARKVGRENARRIYGLK